MRPPWRARPGRIGVLTGAGISTDSGIPDFRGPSGVWTKNPIAELLSTYDAYLSDPDLREARRDDPAWRARPNAAHTITWPPKSSANPSVSLYRDW